MPIAYVSSRASSSHWLQIVTYNVTYIELSFNKRAKQSLVRLNSFLLEVPIWNRGLLSFPILAINYIYLL